MPFNKHLPSRNQSEDQIVVLLDWLWTNKSFIPTRKENTPTLNISLHALETLGRRCEWGAGGGNHLPLTTTTTHPPASSPPILFIYRIIGIVIKLIFYYFKYHYYTMLHCQLSQWGWCPSLLNSALVFHQAESFW